MNGFLELRNLLTCKSAQNTQHNTYEKPVREGECGGSECTRALVIPGLRFLGQTFVQFMIVWQRKSFIGSSTALRRSAVDDAASRESTTQRYICISTAGPRYLSPFHQYDGHDVLQHAHRMHSYMPSSRARFSFD